MATAAVEVSAKEEFDYEVVNDDFTKAREDIIRIMRNVTAEGGS
jgi:guanylate kinase